MRLFLASALVGILGTCCAFGQSPATSAFEVASVKMTAHGRDAGGTSISSLKIASPGRLVGVNTTLQECIRFAYAIREYQVSGPGWITSDEASYDIEAKAPADTSPDQMRLMMQTLLRERFKLVVHRDSKVLPVYLLTVGKNGPRLERARLDEAAPLWSMGGSERVKVTGESASMEGLAGRLTNDLDRPVFDKTGIPGFFRINLEWAREADGASIFAALQEQLGLKLEPSKAPTEILVFDHAERIPTAN